MYRFLVCENENKYQRFISVKAINFHKIETREQHACFELSFYA